MAGVSIRPERPGDADAIAQVTKDAFGDLEISSHTEHLIVNALRDAEAMAISLVAESDGRIVGHICFSPVVITDGTSKWFALGPVSVRPTMQRQGIGKALIREGLATLRAQGAGGCCLVGHPEYYGRFGFTNPPGLGCEGVPCEAFFAQAFNGEMPAGTVSFHAAFSATAQRPQ